MQNNSEIVISQAKNLAQMGAGRFLNAFRAVPEDKMGWSPAPEGRNAIQIACHLAEVNDRLAIVFAGDPMPERAHLEASAINNAQVEEWLHSSAAAILAGLSKLTPERVATDVPTPLGILPMTRLMMIPGIHAFGHAGQIDYLQTLWGDEETHF